MSNKIVTCIFLVSLILINARFVTSQAALDDNQDNEEVYDAQFESSSQSTQTGPVRGSITGTIGRLAITPETPDFEESLIPGPADENFFLFADSGPYEDSIIAVHLCPELRSSPKLFVPPNTRVAVLYESFWPENMTLYICRPPVPLELVYMTNSGMPRLIFEPKLPERPSFIIFLVTMCDFKEPQATTVDAMYDLFTGDQLPRTMAGYFDTCSFGQVRILKSHVKVLGGIQIPCQGTARVPFTFPSGNNFDTTSCMNDNLVKWMYHLDTVASQKFGINALDFNHKVMILPPKFTATINGCNGVAGLGSVGPWQRQLSAANTWGTGGFSVEG